MEELGFKEKERKPSEEQWDSHIPQLIQGSRESKKEKLRE